MRAVSPDKIETGSSTSARTSAPAAPLEPYEGIPAPGLFMTPTLTFFTASSVTCGGKKSLSLSFPCAAPPCQSSPFREQIRTFEHFREVFGGSSAQQHEGRQSQSGLWAQPKSRLRGRQRMR